MKYFPEHGLPRDEVLCALEALRGNDLKSDGHAFAFVFDAGAPLRELSREAYALCMPINGLDPTAYPSARKIENSVVKACLELMHAPEGAVGTATAGGTESVMLAVKAARDHCRKTRPEVTRPKMLLPVTAHACFHKAAHYFDLGVVNVNVDPETFRADVADARAKITDEVILVVASAPGYAHGVIDPIEALAALALERNTLMHVDACVGGWVLPFLRETGVPVPAFDFAVEGVTSMSMDIHKYGFGPKGASVLLQRHRALRDAQYFACATWTGYTIVNSTTLGSKSLSALGAAFAVMHSLGREGYRTHARAMWEATIQLVRAIDDIPCLRVLGRPDMNLLGFTTTTGCVFELADRLTERGWHVQPTYGYPPSPAHIHLTLDPENSSRIDAFTQDLRASMVDLPPAESPPAEAVAMLEQLASSEGGAGALDASALIAALGVSDGQLPARSAMIHRLLDAASPAVRERLLIAFMGELFS